MTTETEKKESGKKKWLLILLILLVLSVIASSIVLFVKISEYIKEDDRNVIELVPDDDGPTTDPDDYEEPTAPPTTDPMNTAHPDGEIFDTDKVWGTKTEVEIFRVSYENGEKEIIIQSDNGEKILAPGASNDYTFWIKNTGNVPLEYEIWVDAYYSDENNAIPILVKLKNSTEYQVGSASQWGTIAELDKAHDEGALSINNYDAYTLSWQWLFEGGDDAYDTYLGNLNLDKPISLTIKIYTKAAMDMDATGGQPSTGDTSPLEAAFVILLLSGATMVFLLLLLYKKRKDEDDVCQTERPQEKI